MIKYAGLDISRRVQSVYQGIKNAKDSKIVGKNTIMAALKLNFTALKRFPTNQRKMILNFTNSFLMTKGLLSSSDTLKFNELSWQYDLLTNAKSYFKEFLSCSFSYWIRDMMQDFLETMATSDGSYFRLQIFLNSLEDSKDLLNNSIHLNSPTELIDEYRHLTMKYMNQKFMNSLSNRISDDLLV
jgi:WASH complex subunit 7